MQEGDCDFSEVIIYILAYLILNITNEMISTGYSYYNAQVGLKFNKFITLKILEKSTKLQLRDYENPEIYDVINRAQNQNAASIISYISEIMLVIKQIITIMSTALILIKFRWWIILVIFLIPFIRCIMTVSTITKNG